MMGILFEIGVSNAVVSLVIAVIAILVGKFTNKPHLTYLIWMLVLVKLLMPSVFNLPVFSNSNSSLKTEIVSQNKSIDTQNTQVQIDSEIVASGFYGVYVTSKSYGQKYIPMIWGTGILLFLTWSMIRIFRFNRLLKISSESASASVYKVAEDASKKLNLKKLPLIKVTSADISPMVWWIGGKVQIFIPSVLIENLETENLRLVLAHELAHIKRRDYLVRWVEWCATVLFWWNPIVWLAKRRLRTYEEICCDALILSSLKPKPHLYATSLLNAVESFAETALRPPSMASKINSGGNFIRRINMILSNKHSQKSSRTLQFVFFFVAALILPLGFVNAQEKEAYKDEMNKVQIEIKAALENGEITPQQAKERMAEFILRMVERKIEQAVAEGKITPEQAQEKLTAYKNKSKSKKVNPEIRKIKEAIKSGEITPEEVRERISAYKLKMVSQKIKKAVEGGNLTPEEGRAKITAFKLEIAAYNLKKAVKEGRMTKEEAKAEYEEIKREMTNKQEEN